MQYMYLTWTVIMFRFLSSFIGGASSTNEVIEDKEYDEEHYDSDNDNDNDNIDSDNDNDNSNNDDVTSQQEALPSGYTLGENKHVAYKWCIDDELCYRFWNSDIKELFTQIFFQTVRKNETTTENLMTNFKSLVTSILSHIDDNVRDSYIDMLVRFICQTRDIVEGKGEYDLAYRFLLEFAFLEYIHKSERLYLTKSILYGFVNTITDGKSLPYGSWKDIHNFLSLMRKTKSISEIADNSDKMTVIRQLHAFCFNIYAIQLAKDMNALVNKRTNQISLCAKWVPREGSKHGWIFNRLAFTIFNKGETADTTSTSVKRHMYKRLRVILSSLNKAIDTTEIKQCRKAYSEIDFKKVPSITMTKQKLAFMNLDDRHRVRSDDPDRIDAASNFRKYIDDLKKGKTKVNAKCNNLTDLVKSAMAVNSITSSINVDIETDTDEDMITLIDEQWKEYSKSIFEEASPNMIAMVDVSGSMAGLPILAAIGLGICVASKSSYGKRVMTFETNPSWVDLEDCGDSFVSMVKKIKCAGWGGSTNFYKALEMLFDDIVKQKKTPQEVKETTLVVFSDMQINEAINAWDCPWNFKTMIEKIREMYYNKGMELMGEPYEPPHILFWNLRSTDNFPSLSQEANASMLSGYSPSMLNEFIRCGDTIVDTFTPFKVMASLLKIPRYTIPESITTQEFTCALSKQQTYDVFTTKLLGDFAKLTQTQ